MRQTSLAMCLALTAVAAAPAQAEDIRLVTGNGYAPYTDEDLPAGGLFTEIVRAAYEGAGHTATVAFVPWKRAERAVVNGKAVAAFPYVVTEERETKYAFSDVVMAPENVPVVAADDAGTIGALDDMKGRSMCLPIGWGSGDPDLDAMMERGEVDVNRAPAIANCLKLIARGRVDFTVMERPSVASAAQEALGGMGDLHMEDFAISRTELYLIFDKGGDSTAEEIESFNAALKDLKASGRFDQIVAKHSGGGA